MDQNAKRYRQVDMANYRNRYVVTLRKYWVDEIVYDILRDEDWLLHRRESDLQVHCKLFPGQYLRYNLYPPREIFLSL